jgi:signal transduction histidine kinase
MYDGKARYFSRRLRSTDNTAMTATHGTTAIAPPRRQKAEPGEARGAIGELEGLFAELAVGGLPRDALARARKRAASVAAAADAGAHGLAALAFATDMFAGLAVELATNHSALSDLIAEIEKLSGVPRVALGHQVLSASQLLKLPTAVALEVQLALLLAFGEQRAVSIWTRWPGGDVRHVGGAGETEVAATPMRREARRLLADGSSRSRARLVTSMVIEGRHEQLVALVALGEGSPADPMPMFEAAAPTLSAILDREELFGRISQPDAELAASTSRRLTRLRFDLHDGPQQDVILLGNDLRLFRSQLETALADHPQRARALGRLDDLQAQLVAVDGDLRRIATFVQSPFLRPEPLPDALATLTDEFAARAGIEPETHLRGDFSKLSDSQQITLLGLIRESLSNIREHSDAKHVTIRLSSDVRGVRATVTDDGRGFDPETSLIRAARDGHLGLVGMYERVRLLDGRTQIDSRPGGPTVISVTLPPLAKAAATP